jgi:hypothetical protein
MKIDNLGGPGQFSKTSRIMKHLLIALAIGASLTASAQIGVDAIAKQRARDAANQTSSRGIEPSGANPAAGRPATAPPTVTATPLTPSQQAYASFQSQLLAVNTNSSPADKQDLAGNLGKVAQGATKPSAATLSKLSDHLTAALAEAKLTSQRKIRVAQNVAVLMNTAAMPAQKQAMIKDVESILHSGGASSENTAAVTADLQAITDELKPK